MIRPAMSPLSSKRLEAALALALLASVLLAYHRLPTHRFVHLDDPMYVVDNHRVRGGLEPENLRWALTTPYAANWHPLTWISHMADVELWGMHPGGHHFTSLLLHAANSLLLFFLLRRMTGSLYRSWLAAALFALHPLHVESVAWISERKDVLSALFWMLTLWAWLRWTEAPSPVRYTAVLAAFTAGLMSKPMVVTLPFVLLLLDGWPLNRLCASGATGPAHALGVRVREKLPLFALSALGCAAALWSQGSHSAIRSTEAYPLVVRAANAVVAYGAYLGKTVWPSGLAPFYPHPGWAAVGPKALLAAGFLAAVSALAWRLRKSRPYFLVGWLWYLGTLVPVIGLVQVGEQAMADRYTYIPLIGVFVALSWALGPLRRHGRAGRWVPAIAFFALAAFGTATFFQAAVWRDSETLFRHTLAVTENNHKAHHGLALALALKGEREQSLAHYRRAVEIHPRFPEARNDLALELMRAGALDEAVAQLERALEIHSVQGRVHNNLGVAYIRQGRIEDAVRQFELALRVRPDYPSARENLKTARAELAEKSGCEEPWQSAEGGCGGRTDR